MSSFWILVDRLGPALVLIGLVAPILGCVVGAILGSRRQTHSGTYLTGRGAGRGLALGALATIPLLYLGMCSVPAGAGRLAADGYRRADPILRALEEYHTRFATYPDSLQQLVPTLLSASDLAGPESTHPFQLGRVGTVFVLSFKYVGPGMNECKYPSQTKKWTCSGYY